MVIFKGKEAALPGADEAAAGDVSNFMVNYWYVLLAAVIVLVWGIRPDAAHRLGPALV